ncbi:isocitrate lyase/phosphoenolpyruvate mutase family protein [Euzebya sp.]|uniref:isocitrate lyase/PEP mutase family protein n=1 Tax=Euzebya sp. TaxID=1971409 RepID=UPI003517709D
MDPAAARRAFADLHRDGTFTIPNPWDLGSARLLAHLGFAALASTSSGFAASLGARDQQVTADELVDHAAALCAAVEVPVHVDAEDGHGATAADVTATVERLVAVGVAGVSIEDHDPSAGVIRDVDDAVDRVAAAAAVCAPAGVVLTARAENHLYDAGDLDDTISRLRRYAEAGADVLYAPGLADLDDIARVVTAVDRPVNVLALRHGPSAPDLAGVGVRRISTGGSLAWAAYGAVVAAVEELRGPGTSTYLDAALPAAIRDAAWGREPRA